MQTAAEHFEAGVPGMPGGIPVFYEGADDDDESVRRLSALELQESKSWPSIDVHVEEERPASPPAGSAPVFSPREVMFGEVFGLGRAVVAGVTSLAVLEAHFYLSGGCSAARWAREKYAHQISNHMCCPVDWYIGAAGAGTTGILALLAAPSVRRRRDALGHCCCCCRGGGARAAPAVAVLLAIAAVGLVLLAVFQMCWQPGLHAIGAVLFFVFGGAMCGVVVLSARDAASRAHSGSLFARALTASLLLAGICLFFIWNPFAAEWFAVAGITTGFASVQLDLALEERRTRADPRWRQPREARLDAAGAST